MRLEEEIDKKLEEYRQPYKKAIDAMLSQIQEWGWNDPVTCILYTPDAADDLLSVDLGCGLIIKKKTV